LELGVDLTQLKSSSPDGRILLEDVKAFVEQRARNGSPKVDESAKQISATPLVIPLPSVVVAAAPGEEERRPLVGLRRRIAERMEQAWRTIPHVTTFNEVDATELIALRQKLKPTAEKKGLHLTYLPLIARVVISTLKEFPIFNASLDETSRELIYKRYYHLGIATATPDGLLVPVLREADHKNILELAAEITRLSAGARQRSLNRAELSGSTFTLTNFGSYDDGLGTPIINPPEVAILGIGRIQEKVVVQAGQPVVRSCLPLCLSFDHRVIDGADSGAFMARLKELLQNPSLLLLEC
jgi:pyruvate dehydrogenase E2 component (dihydrolipoamide acetyltransferase)